MNKLFAFLIICSLSLPVLAINEQEANIEPPEQNSYEEVQNAVEELNQNSANKAEDVIVSNNKENLDTPFKEPVSKKKLAKKFIIAMLCVAGTSIFLYGTLSLYNKIRNGFLANEITPPEGEKPLDAPSDLTEAIKTFIDKTHWQG